MGFISAIPEGMMGAAASTAALSAESAGHTAQAAAAGAVVPMGADPDISPMNVIKVAAYAANVAGVLGAASAVEGLYGSSLGVSSGMYTLTDMLSALELANVVA